MIMLENFMFEGERECYYRAATQQDIQIHVPYLEDTAQHVLLDWYHEGLDALGQWEPSHGFPSRSR